MDTSIITIDFETYYDKSYSLKRMTLLEYLNDERFKIHGCAFKIGAAPAIWADGEQRVAELVAELARLDRPVLSHNSMFDAGILAYKFNYVPKFIFDTYSMALAAGCVRASLGALSEKFGLGKKIEGALESTCEMVHLPFETRVMLANYSRNDAELCYKLFFKLLDMVTDDELLLISWTVRLFLRRTLVIDINKAIREHVSISAARDRAFEEVGMTEKELRNNAAMINALNALGYSVPSKPGKRGPMPGLAKSDKWVREALLSDDARLSSLVKARLIAQSSVALTRVARFVRLANFGSFGAQLRYYGAHTGRWSGDGAINLQNLPRASDELGGGLRSLIEPMPFYDS